MVAAALYDIAVIVNIPRLFRFNVVEQKPKPKGFSEGPLPAYRQHFATVEGPYLVVDTNVFVSSLPNAAALKSFEDRIRQSAERFAAEHGLHLLPP
jgi:hypothetical protein